MKNDMLDCIREIEEKVRTDANLLSLEPVFLAPSPYWNKLKSMLMR
jgi:hypothetical protein